MDRRRKENPSFSSTLLDVISRSIDEIDDRKPVRNRRSIDGCFQVPQQSSGGSRRNSATGLESNSFYNTSNTGSLGSRYNTESIYGFPARPRPIRTSISHHDECNTPEDVTVKPKADRKSRAMKKIYAYLKKGKQPISPGSRLATFLYSLFTTTNTKKSKMPSAYNEAIVHANINPKSSSSASSLSTRGKLTTNLKRFYPVNEYSQPLAGDMSLINGELKKHLTEKNRRVEETSKTTLKNYQRKVEYVFGSIQNNVTSNDGDDDDDASSYASSDLFELDHLSAIGMERCMQELPLYETTSVDANRAIANGLLV